VCCLGAFLPGSCWTCSFTGWWPLDLGIRCFPHFLTLFLHEGTVLLLVHTLTLIIWSPCHHLWCRTRFGPLCRILIVPFRHTVFLVNILDDLIVFCLQNGFLAFYSLLLLNTYYWNNLILTYPFHSCVSYYSFLILLPQSSQCKSLICPCAISSTVGNSVPLCSSTFYCQSCREYMHQSPYLRHRSLLPARTFHCTWYDHF